MNWPRLKNSLEKNNELRSALLRAGRSRSFGVCEQ